ncbi:MAG: M28 family peptidase [Planctomycetota bacterium]
MRSSPGLEVASKDDSKFDAKASYQYLIDICDIGPRMSTSRGMVKQQEYLKAHFEKLDGAVYFQPFEVFHPLDGRRVELNNMLVRWHPQREKRLLICCHYDTRPFPDRDPVNPRGRFIGANDGGSGVALLCELGQHVGALSGLFGVDFVFFDGEEFVYVAKKDPMFLGSTHFSREYAKGRVRANYIAGVLVDMVGDKNLELYYEGNSLNKAPRVTRDLWSIAGRLGIKEFVPKRRHKIRDDHLPLNRIARIPVCDIIDFDYPVEGNDYWHTEKDIVSNCSADSLGKVGTVVLEWLREMQSRK